MITWSNMWGGVGLVGLSSKNLPMLNIMRAYISDAGIKNWEFCSIPKEGIIFNKDLSVMLRGDMAGISPADFPAMLYRRNPGLEGELMVTKCKNFTDKDNTKRGQSMAGWRLFKLQGDEEFFTSLKQFEESHQFRVGNGNVLIRGGDRIGPQAGGSGGSGNNNNGNGSGGGGGGSRGEGGSGSGGGNNKDKGSGQSGA